MAEEQPSPSPLSVYIHIPFCKVRCSYCDFNTYAGLNDLIPTYSDALAKEIRLVGRASPRRLPVHTVFFGGGTPSLMPIGHLESVLEPLRSNFELLPEAEITLEANPGTVDLAYLQGLRRLGVNRLSLGVQSAHERELRLFDRLHSFDDTVEAVAMARQAGFENLNLDLIFGIPNQTLPMWRQTLTRALALEPQHLSAYALSLEHGTPLRSWVNRGLVAAPNPDLAAEMYEWASETLAADGFVQYEISNWAAVEDRSQKSEVGSRKRVILTSDLRPLTSDLRCRHNLQYWRNLPYLGIGAGAHGYAEGWRYSNVLGPKQFIDRLAEGAEAQFPFSPAMAERRPVTPDDAMGETMMLGMRLVREGVGLEDFARRFSVRLEDRYRRELRSLTRSGLIEIDSGRLRLTPRARLLGNRVFSEFVGS